MSTNPDNKPRGMTLVELLVVIAIIGVLAVAVLPNVTNTAETRRSREAARIVSSFIAKAQSRAIGRREWSGFTMGAPTTTPSYAAIDLFLADVPSVYRGDTVPATLTITGSLSQSIRMATGMQGQLTLSGSTGANVLAGDLIRFAGSGPWYEITGSLTGTSISFQPRGYNSGSAALECIGNELHNTPWPPLSAPLASGTTPLSFEIMRQPVSIGSPVTLTDGRVVDLYWSGVGPPWLKLGSTTLTGTYQRFGTSTTVLFDGTGRLRKVICRPATPTSPSVVTGPVYLLVGRADRVNNISYVPNPDDVSGANWQYPDSFWVAIDPATGVVKTAESAFFGEDDNRNGVLDSGEDANNNGALDIDVIASQKWIRQALFSGGQ